MDLRISSSTAPLTGAGLARRAAAPQNADNEVGFSGALKGALNGSEFIKRQEAVGAVVVSDARVNGAEHKKFVESEIAKWGPAIKAAGQYAD